MALKQLQMLTITKNPALTCSFNIDVYNFCITNWIALDTQADTPHALPDSHSCNYDRH
jgi:hypothetical protein